MDGSARRSARKNVRIMENILQTLKDIGAVQEGEFILKSGKTSHLYFDIKKAYGNPEVFAEIISAICELIPKEATCIAGSGNGGIPLATAVSLKLKKKLSIVRDTKKNHGIQKHIDGHIPDLSDVVVIVDDVLSSGTSLRNTIKHLGDAHISMCVVLVKRGEVQGVEIPVRSVLDTTSNHSS